MVPCARVCIPGLGSSFLPFVGDYLCVINFRGKATTFKACVLHKFPTIRCKIAFKNQQTLGLLVIFTYTSGRYIQLRKGTDVKAEQRHQEIIRLVESNGEVNTDELVERFSVSPQTIRRDLNELAELNNLRRTHGGATNLSSSENSSYSNRKVMHPRQKELIAATMAKHIPNGSTLFIDIGTTPEAFARALTVGHSDLRIVTNNINVAMILMERPDFKVILAGGEVRNIDGGVTGEATLDFISQFRLDFGVLGISGIDNDGSLLDFDYHEVRVKKAIIENSRQTLLGVDHSKFGRNAMVKLGNLSEIDLVVTDQLPPEPLASILAECETQIEVVTL